MIEEPDPGIERKTKAFDVARHLKANTYTLRIVWFEDEEKWGLICTAMIEDTLYDCVNFMDDFEAQEHAEMFRMAFSEALKDVQKKKKSQLITLH